MKDNFCSLTKKIANVVYLNMEPEILFENNDVIVVDKPSGLMVHADGTADERTLVDWLLEHDPNVQGVGEPGFAKDGSALERSGVVHRLDRDTSGVMVLAKHQAAFEHLKAQFHDRLAKKEYRAFVYGPVRERWGTIDKSIGRSPRDFRLRLAGPGAKGTLRDAVTEWECIGTGRHQDELYSYLKLKPKTGRTHQIRVHLKSISRPVVGDPLYAASEIERLPNLGIDRLALHAHRLLITLPDGEEGAFIAPEPIAFIQAAELLVAEA